MHSYIQRCIDGHVKLSHAICSSKHRALSVDIDLHIRNHNTLVVLHGNLQRGTLLWIVKIHPREVCNGAYIYIVRSVIGCNAFLFPQASRLVEAPKRNGAGFVVLELIRNRESQRCGLTISQLQFLAVITLHLNLSHTIGNQLNLLAICSAILTVTYGSKVTTRHHLSKFVIIRIQIVHRSTDITRIGDTSSSILKTILLEYSIHTTCGRQIERGSRILISRSIIITIAFFSHYNFPYGISLFK